MSTFFKYFKHEIVSKLFSSKKKLIKFIAISLVPFLYGFICIWAFWNPVPNIGKVPMAIVDTSQRIDLAVGLDQNKRIVIGEVGSLDSNQVPNSIKNPEPNGAPIPITKCISYQKSYSFVESFLDGWSTTTIKNPLIHRNPNGTYTIHISDTAPLQNVSYFNDQTPTKATDIATYNPNLDHPINKGTKGAWEVKDENYWMQIQIPTIFNTVFASTLTSMYLSNPTSQPGVQLSWASSLEALKEEPINIWRTFKKNFLFGQFMKVFHEFKSSLYIDFFPRLIVQTIANILTSTTSNIVDSYYNELFFIPTKDITAKGVNAKFHIGSFGEKNSIYNGDITFNAGNQYIIRNNELRDAIYNAIASDATIPDVDKNKLKTLYTFEGNTTTMVSEKNDWVSNDLSFIDLVNKLVKPIINSIFPNEDKPNNEQTEKPEPQLKSQATLASNIPLNKYLVNKMFLTALLERDGKVFPKQKPIVNKSLDITVRLIIPNLRLPIAFSNEQPATVKKVILTSAQWNDYMAKLGNSLKEAFDTIIKPSKPDKPFYATAPPDSNNQNNNQQGINLDGIITSGVIGNEYSAYGIGLGQFFLFIGIWVGILMQTFMLDRNRRGLATQPMSFHSKRKKKKISLFSRLSEAMTWYFSKTLLMLFLTFVQITILSATVAGIGWSEIGPPFGLVYLQLLFSGLVFTLFIQALWFFFRDEVIGKFIVILFLIINLSSGWGTFPPDMQHPFFKVLSYIAPFTYQIRNVGAIIYGVGVVGTNAQDTLFIMNNIGVSFIFVVISLLLGIFGSLKLTKMQFYGTFNEKKLFKVMLQLKQYGVNNPDYQSDIDFDNIMVKKPTLWKKLHLDSVFNKSAEKDGINWDSMPQGYDSFICENFNKQYPYETKFKWFKKRYPHAMEEIKDAQL